MEPADMAFQDLTTSRISNTRAICIFNRRGLVYYGRITGIFETPIRVIGRCFFSNDRILETSFLKSYLPVINALDQIRDPFFRSSRVNIKNDWLFWFYQFPPHVFSPILIFWFQAPADDHAVILDTLGICIIIGITAIIKSYALVIKTLLHRFCRQQNK